jgi:LysM repeat protein
MANLDLNHTQLAHARDIVAAVRRRGLARRHAVIAIETALTESRLRMYANRNNPASLALPHEAVGSDHGSVGLFQQQVGGARHSTANWGTTAQLMNAAVSTGKFLDALARHDLAGRTNWQAAQSVQRSAFADGRNYRANDAEAQRIVDELWDDATGTTSSSTDNPAAHQPATNPPATNPPATNPPATNPPATNPPATNPPATNPQATIGSTGSVDYVVRAGDTLFAIAARFGFTWRELADLNHLDDPDLLQPGQHLRVPATPGAAGSQGSPAPHVLTSTYTVRPGDSLFAIAQRFDTSWQHLAQVNHLADPDLIQPGQTLTVG